MTDGETDRTIRPECVQSAASVNLTHTFPAGPNAPLQPQRLMIAPAAVGCKRLLGRGGRATIALAIEAGCCSSRSLALEYPDVILVMIGSPNLFRRAETSTTVDQFVPKRDLHLAARMLRPERND
jgi:hypothetical protein